MKETAQNNADLLTLRRSIDQALELLRSESKEFTGEQRAKIEEGLSAGQRFGENLLAIDNLELAESGGQFIPIEVGRSRAKDFDDWLDGNISIPSIRSKFKVVRFVINASRIRELLTDEDASGALAEYLLVYPAFRNKELTLVFASGQSNGAVISTNQRSGNEVLDEIEPCKGSGCPKL